MRTATAGTPSRPLSCEQTAVGLAGDQDVPAVVEQPASLGQDPDLLAAEADGRLGVQDEPGRGGHPTILDDGRLPAHEAIAAVPVRDTVLRRPFPGTKR